LAATEGARAAETLDSGQKADGSNPSLSSGESVLREMIAERGLSTAHTTIMRWVQRYAREFEKRWRRCARAVGRSWRVDETYIKIRGEWSYLYRAYLAGNLGRLLAKDELLAAVWPNESARRRQISGS